jgi:DNA-binding response OmpR family regulator
MPPMSTHRARPVLVVDDDAKIVGLIRTYLEREGLPVVEALDGPSALARVDADDPALVVLDLMLPGIDGLTVIEAIRDRAATPIIVLSARGTTADRIAGLGLGADDYVPKPFSPAELVLRVKRVLARTSGGASEVTAPPDPILALDGLVVDRARHEVVLDGRAVPLTAVEFRLLVAILEADGRVLSRDLLLDAVYGPDADALVDRTIDVHIGRLRDKLADSPATPRFIATVRGVGYRAVRQARQADAGEDLAR